MPDNDKDAFLKSIAKGKRLLGLDIGEKTIGLALSDTELNIASADETIKRKKFTKDAEILKSKIEEFDVGGLVIGLPLELNGNEGKKCQSVRQFGRNFQKLFEIPIFFQDERFSTVAAEETLLEADMSREKRKEVIDKVAASYILQNFLDS